MLKKFSVFVLATVVAPFASAEGLSVVQSAGNSDLFSIFIDTGDVAGTVDSIDIDIIGTETFLNFNEFGFDGATPLTSDAEQSFVNPLLALAASPPFFGLGFSNPSGTTGDADGLSFAGGPLGSTIDPGEIFIANVLLAPGSSATASIDFVGGGAVLESASITFPDAGGDVVTLTPADGAVFDLAINSNPEIIDAITATGGTITGASFDDPAADALLNLTFDDDSVSIAIDTTQDFTGLSPDTILSETFTVLTSDGASAQFTINAAVPEPASLALLGLGFAGVIARRRLV